MNSAMKPFCHVLGGDLDEEKRGCANIIGKFADAVDQGYGFWKTSAPVAHNESQGCKDRAGVRYSGAVVAEGGKQVTLISILGFVGTFLVCILWATRPASKDNHHPHH
jgi:hypothetical protein